MLQNECRQSMSQVPSGGKTESKYILLLQGINFEFLNILYDML